MRFFPEAGAGLKPLLLILVLLVAALAGFWDWRWRRIPNWLTVSALIAGVAANTALSGLAGLKTSLLGAGLGLLVLLPFVFLRSLGAGDWKLAGALGACVGWRDLLGLLIWSMFVAGLMAVVLIIYKRRVLETLRNMARMLAALLTFHLPGAEVSLDNPRALKIPYGVALALTTVAYAITNLRVLWGA